MTAPPLTFEELPRVGTWDYILFVIMLSISLGIGIFQATRDWRRKKRDELHVDVTNGNPDEGTEEYFAGGHKMNVFAISMSMIATYVHSNLILGYPAEMYYNGAQYWLYCGGQAVGAILAIVVFVPVFYPLQMTSVNEYLHLRFNHVFVKWIGMFCSVIALLFLTGITFFGPATALEIVTDIPDYGYIIILTFVTILYTAIGGFKAVIWTDVFQSVVMITGMIAIVAKGTHEVGNINDIYDLYSKWDRNTFIDLSADPTQRLTFWGLICGVGLTFMGIYGSSQVGVQRYSSLSTRLKANISILSVIPGSIFFTSLACLCGIVIFAYFAKLGCDPLVSRQIENPNQIVPYFLMRVLNHPGVPGIFLAAMCAGALSTASSCINSSAANIWEDLLKHVLPEKLKTKKAVEVISKLTVVVCGIIAMCLSFVVMSIGGTLTQAFGSFAAAVGGPVVGLFIMGLFIPWTNWKGACVGTIFGMTFTLWVAIGSYTIGNQRSKLPLPLDQCPVRPPRPPEWSVSGIEHLYTLSFLWFKEAGSGITIFVGTIVSFLTGATDPRTIHPCLLHPIVRWALRKSGRLMSEADSSTNDPRLYKEHPQPHNGIENTAFWVSRNDVSFNEKGHPAEDSIKSVSASIYDQQDKHKDHPVEKPVGEYTVYHHSTSV